MNISIEARALSAKGGGVRSYTYELIRNLVALKTNHKLSVLLDSESATGSVKGAKEKVVPLAHSTLLPYWLSYQVPRALKETKADVVHFTKADISNTKSLPTVVTIYDVIPLLFPESQSFMRRMYWPGALKRASLADHILTISLASKRDIVDRLQVDPDKVTVTPLAVDLEHFRPRVFGESGAAQSVLKKHGVHQPYILFVGTRDRRKNISALIRAFYSLKQDIPHTLVIVGRGAYKKDESRELVSRLQLQSRVKFLEGVSYDELPSFYSGADLFVWPSVYEGWGFPPQEAMACGTPVVVSDGGSLPEVVGEAGEIVSFSSSDVRDRLEEKEFDTKLASSVERVLHDSGLRERMRQKGFTRVKEFSWKRVAEQTLDVYEKVGNR